LYGVGTDGLEAIGSTGFGVYAASTSGVGVSGSSQSYIGVVGTGDPGLVGKSSAEPFLLEDSNNNTLAYSDSSGNFFIHGSYGTFLRVNGATLMTYVPTAASPSIEDAGTAQLVNGQAVVKLNPTLAHAIDASRPYQVFLTPGGDTRGLYVASKSASSFVVREVQGGRGTFDFDYHVHAPALRPSTNLGPPKVPIVPPPTPKLPLGPAISQ
jgi:hypothetical protein